MSFDEFEEHQRFREAWNAVEIARPVHYSLFTFGESDLPYYLVCSPSEPGGMASMTKGEVKITRPLLITPESAEPEFRNFFESQDEEGVADFLLQRTAAFRHLKFDNRAGQEQIISDSVEEIVAKLNRQLDAEEEDRVAILTAPPHLAGMAVFRFAAERVMASAPENVQELRERGFLP